MQKILIVVDMQNDFVSGVLGTKEAVGIVPSVVSLIKKFDGTVLFTRDTHYENYFDTQEGRLLPVKHCIKDTQGWQIVKEIECLRKTEPIDKPTFASNDLIAKLKELNEKEKIESVTFCGVCTDICVVSNAMLVKATFPETTVYVESSCCAGVTVEKHNAALNVLASCQCIVK